MDASKQRYNRLPWLRRGTKTLKSQSKPGSRATDLVAHTGLPQPYQRLFSDGRPDAYGPVFWRNFLADINARPLAEAIDVLSRIALDRSYVSYSRHSEHDLRAATPIRALRTLSSLGKDALPAAKRVLPLLWTFDDTATEAVVAFYRSQGPAMLPLLEEWLNSSWNEDNNPVACRSEVLGVMPVDHPASLVEICALLQRTVDNTKNSKETTAWCIFCLLELEDRGAIDTILAAFQADRVDTEIITLQDVLDEFNIELVPDVDNGLIQVMASVPRRPRPEEEFILPEFAAKPEPEKPVVLPFVSSDHVGRNHPCPCGSGKKYKKCCGFTA